MNDLIIRQLRASDKEAFLIFVKAWQEEDNPFLQRLVATFSDIDFSNFAGYLEELKAKERPSDDSQSSSSIYFAFQGNKIVGRLACRWELEKGDLIKLAGNLGYSVVKDARRQGVAQAMLSFALQEFTKRGVSQILVSAREDNFASRRLLEKFGGKLENTIVQDGESFCRYWLKTNPTNLFN